MELLFEITGWAGAVAMLGGYMAVSMGWLQAGTTFQTVNLFGSCAFIVNGTLHGAWPSVVTNVAWFLISAVALLRMRARAGGAAGADCADGAPGSRGPLSCPRHCRPSHRRGHPPSRHLRLARPQAAPGPGVTGSPAAINGPGITKGNVPPSSAGPEPILGK